MVLVARPRNDDSGRPAKPRRVTDEDVLCAGGDESVEQILCEPVIDLRRRSRRPTAADATERASRRLLERALQHVVHQRLVRRALGRAHHLADEEPEQLVVAALVLGPLRASVD